MKVDPEQISTPPDGKPMSEQPAWRQDFPIDTPQDNYVARRDFTKFMVLTSLAFTAGQFWIGAQSALSKGEHAGAAMKIGEFSKLKVGDAITFAFPDPHDTCILLKTETGLVAYGQKCTHLSCAVTPDMKKGCLHCPCHNGNFDLATGRPLSGPPRRPLPKIHLELRGDEIFAVRVEERTT